MPVFAVFSEFLLTCPVLIQFLFQFLLQLVFAILLAGPREPSFLQVAKKRECFAFFNRLAESLVLVALPAKP